MAIDFNNAGQQKNFELIPNNTICVVEMGIKPGGVGDDGCLTRANDGKSQHLACDFTIIDGKYTKRKIFARYTLSGTTPGHAEAAKISGKTCRAILESARNIRPDDISETANAGRQVKGWADFHGLRLVARNGIEPPKGGYEGKNIIKQIIVPGDHDYKQPEQPSSGPLSPMSSSSPPDQSAAAAAPIIRPEWAK